MRGEIVVMPLARLRRPLRRACGPVVLDCLGAHERPLALIRMLLDLLKAGRLPWGGVALAGLAEEPLALLRATGADAFFVIAPGIEEARARLEKLSYTRSRTIAMPCPPPMHALAMP